MNICYDNFEIIEKYQRSEVLYQKQILFEKLKEATASVLPISLIVMAISFVLIGALNLV